MYAVLFGSGDGKCVIGVVEVEGEYYRSLKMVLLQANSFKLIVKCAARPSAIA